MPTAAFDRCEGPAEPGGARDKPVGINGQRSAGQASQDICVVENRASICRHSPSSPRGSCLVACQRWPHARFRPVVGWARGCVC